MSDNKGWICPSCGRGVAPGEKTCDHGGQMWNIPPRYLPDTPAAPPSYPHRMSVCGCPVGSICGSAACPHRAIVIWSATASGDFKARQ